MRLISAHVHGAGRLVDTIIKLDQKVIAVVGPNEAGKSTLLKALAFADGNDALTPAERSRSKHIEDAARVISLRYLLDEDDRAEVSQFDLEQPPGEIRISRRADGGNPIKEVLPMPRKSENDLKALTSVLSAELKKKSGLKPLPQEDDELPPDGQALLDELNLLHDDLETYLATTVDDRDPMDVLRQRADEDLGKLAAFKDVAKLTTPLTKLVAWADREDPREKVQEALWNRTPDLAIFDDDDRTLSSTYVLDDNLLANVPAALENFARLAKLDVGALVEAVKTGQIARRDTIKNKANQQLQVFFKDAWKQSDIKVELNVENNLLRIGLVEDGVHASVFDERSAGLRMFVALNAFLASRDTGRPTILLIDEAETHLHIDAQADLVDMFAQQGKADKIIYTTHSPACLPADLGVGIRAVVPEGDETSRVENNFWRLKGGAFTSLMYAMGASAAAFTPARFAVIAEGASDMILLPSLVRTATALERLPYQVAPGLSEVPKDYYPDLDFEASKVAFIVDSDSGGGDLTRVLGREVPDAQVVGLGVPGIENVLDPACYLQAFTTVLSELNPSATITALPTLPACTETSWATASRLGQDIRLAGAREARSCRPPHRPGNNHTQCRWRRGSQVCALPTRRGARHHRPATTRTTKKVTRSCVALVHAGAPSHPLASVRQERSTLRG